jgi:glycosyltransferase involved in cell wall biosynthesis
VNGEPTWLVYHSSIGSQLAEFVRTRPEPLIVDYHNITPPAFFARWEPHVAGQLAAGRRQLAKLALRAELGLADSAFNARELRQFDYTNTAVVPILLDTDELAASPPDPARTARLVAEKARGGADWLFVGRLTPNKAQHDIVKAFAAYRRLHDPNARLHLVGSSASNLYTYSLQEFVTALGLDHCVDLPGGVTEAEKRSYYDQADVFVVCSEHEGFCVPLLEAMHHDVPIVAYASSAVPETLGDAGLVLPTKDPLTVAAAVHRVREDDALRAQLIAAGRRRLDAFSLDRSRAALLEAIEATVGTP